MIKIMYNRWMGYRKSGQFINNNESVKLAFSGFYNNPKDDFYYEAAVSGIENSTFFISAHDEVFALRVYRQGKKRLNDIKFEIDFMLQLRTNFVPVPELFHAINGSYVHSFTFQGKIWHAILMKKMGGEHPHTYTDRVIDELATYHPIMHRVGMELLETHPKKIHNPILRELEFTHLVKPNMTKSSKHRNLIERAREYSVKLPPGLRYGYCHFDYDVTNVIANKAGRLTAILDFDDLDVGPIVKCLAYTLWDIYTSAKNVQMLSRYLKKYQQIINLTVAEKNIIVPLMLLRHYAITSLITIKGEMDKGTLDSFVEIEDFLKGNDVITALI